MAKKKKRNGKRQSRQKPKNDILRRGGEGERGTRQTRGLGLPLFGGSLPGPLFSTGSPGAVPRGSEKMALELLQAGESVKGPLRRSSNHLSGTWRSIIRSSPRLKQSAPARSRRKSPLSRTSTRAMSRCPGHGTVPPAYLLLKPRHGTTPPPTPHLNSP